jgi:hypothetical protein
VDLGVVGWGDVDWTGLDWSGSGKEKVDIYCEFGNEPSGSTK